MSSKTAPGRGSGPPSSISRCQHYAAEDDALAVLRGQLGRQHVDFDRVDIAYAVLWQRLHPHLRLSKEELSFVEYSSILGDILDHFSPLPVFGTAMGLVKLFERGSTDVRRRRRIRRDPTLQALDGLPNGELAMR